MYNEKEKLLDIESGNRKSKVTVAFSRFFFLVYISIKEFQ